MKTDLKLQTNFTDFLFKSCLYDSDRDQVVKWLEDNLGPKYDEDDEDIKWYVSGDNDNIMVSHFDVFIRDPEYATSFALTYPQAVLVPSHFSRVFQ